MPLSLPLLYGIALLSAAAFWPCAAFATLHTVGREFRPSTEQRRGANSCLSADGVTASIVFEPCLSISCPGVNPGVLWAEWRNANGGSQADPVVISEWDYTSTLSYACSADGTIYLVLEPGLRIVSRDGVRAEIPRICAVGEECRGPFDVAAGPNAFLVTWNNEGVGIFGRRFQLDGEFDSPGFLIAALNEPSRARLGTMGDDYLVAWRRTEEDPAVLATRVAADGSIDPVVQVNEFARLEDDGLEVGADESGISFVAWNNWPQGGWVARRVSANENPTTTTTTTLEPGPHDFLPSQQIGERAWGNPDTPQLCGDDSGRWMVSWPDRLPWEDDDVWGSVATRSIDDARRWAAPQPFHADHPGAFGSVLAGNGTGVTIDAWEDRSKATIFFRRSTDGGQTWSVAAPLYVAATGAEGSDGSSSISNLAIAAAGDGHWLASWIEDTEIECTGDDDGCDEFGWKSLVCGVRSSISTDGGLTWSPVRDVAFGGCWGSEALAIAGDGNGNWLALWKDGADYEEVLRTAHSADDAGHWSLPRTLFPAAEISYSGVAVAASSEGVWVLSFGRRLYEIESNGGEEEYGRLYVSRSASPSGPWSEPTGIAPWHDTAGGEDRDPSLAAGPDGELAMVWSSYSSSGGLDSDIVSSFSVDSGQTWTPARPVDAAAEQDSLTDVHPRLVRAGAVWAVAWRAQELGSPILFARTRGNCGNVEVDWNEECDDGDVVDGDGCDANCLRTGCGNLVVTDGEECDDGNTDQSDECIDCIIAVCGDGYVHPVSEDCDDGNDDDTDDCLGTCEVARCGDFAVHAGTETCDDGGAPGNNDGCIAGCRAATCGDGYLQLGEEECDDGNLQAGDGCSPACLLEPRCGLLDRSGLRVTASDALRVLRRAVGITLRCPLRDCDLNGDGNLGVIDALWTLRSAVGLLTDGCSWPTRFVLRMTSADNVSALQVRISYADAAGRVLLKSDGKPDCDVEDSTLALVHLDESERWLRMGLATLQGLQGPVDVMTCEFDPVSGPSLHDFHVEIEDATDYDSNDLAPELVVTLE